MTRARMPADWERDLAAARPVEKRVLEALRGHPEISHLADFTSELDALDFDFRFERQQVHVDVKAKLQRSSEEIADLWPEIPRDDLFVLDETSFRELVWKDGLGYLLVHDQPRELWHVFGPWELCLGPRRRFERRGNKTGTDFLKGKLLLDLRTASRTTRDLDVDALLQVVRASRALLRHVRAVPVRHGGDLPVIPTGGPARTDSGEVVGPGTRFSTEANAGSADLGWCGLSAELTDAVKTKWGWDEPTAVQRAAFPAILQGRNVLILAPTAGGKTEAALLPLLDMHRQHGWGGARPAIVAISPLKALLDDQLERWRRAMALIGGSAFAWHGDVGADAKKAFKDNPHDALLTTPESLELLLTSPSHDAGALFAGLRAVVVDEVHAFVGTPRGAQLASLLERLFQLVEQDFQRIGLSATVGNADRVLDWVRGGSLREYEVIHCTPRMQGEDVSVRSYADDSEAVSVITDAVRGHRSLIFARSRKRAEQLGHLLGIPVHHSSVASTDRDAAVTALRNGSARSVVATASLEMGIDIGDLDLVVQDGAPSSPSSYLQRIGRAGRATGQRRLVCTVAQADDLVLLLAILARVRRGQLEQVDPQRGARLVLGQQAIAVTYQSFIADRAELRETLRWSPTFAGLEAEIESTIDHLLANRWLQADAHRLVLGPTGHRRFGGPRGVVDLLATFQTFAGATVVDEAGRRIGTIDWSQVDSSEGPSAQQGFLLSGRPWSVVRIDREEGLVTVQPGDRAKPPSWRGPMVEVERTTWEAVKDVLNSTEVPIELDARAESWLETERSRWRQRIDAPVRPTDEGTVVDSFCGVQIHRAALAALGVDGSVEGTTCELAVPLAQAAELARELLNNFDDVLDGEAARIAPRLQIRYPELIAPSVLMAEARRFHVDAHGFHRFLSLLAEA